MLSLGFVIDRKILDLCFCPMLVVVEINHAYFSSIKEDPIVIELALTQDVLNLFSS